MNSTLTLPVRPREECILVQREEQRRKARQGIWREFQSYLAAGRFAEGRLWFWWNGEYAEHATLCQTYKGPVPSMDRPRVYIDVEDGDCEELIRFKFQRAFEQQCPQLG